MKLYARVVSERASKGQGGNEYLKVIVRNVKQQVISYITFKPDNTCHIEVIKEVQATFDNEVEWIGTDDDTKTTKGKKQKDEKCYCSDDDISIPHYH